VDQIIAGLNEAGVSFSVDDLERGLKRYFGKAELVDKLVGGFRQAGYD
jgi:hypothetical protein